MLWTIIKSLGLLLFVSIIAGCAASVPMSSEILEEKSNKILLGAEHLHEIPVSPFYFPDPREDRVDHAYALTIASSAGKPFYGFLRPNQMLIDSLFDFFTGLEMTNGQLSQGEKSWSTTDACRGSRSVEASFQSDGSFRGVIIFQDYSDNCSLVFDTTLPFQGQIDASTGQLTAELSPKELAARSETRECLIDGKLTLTMNVFQGPRQKYSALVNLSLKEAAGQSYRLDNMQLVWDETEKYPLFSMAGRIHFSKYGSVDMITDGFLLSHTKNGQPFDGIIKFNGAENTFLQLRFPNPSYPGSFRIENQNGTMRTMGNF